MLTSGHSVYDSRIYYKEVLSLRKKYDDIYIIAPGSFDFVTDDGIKVKCFAPRKNWLDRFRPMKDLYDLAAYVDADIYHAHEPDSLQVAVNLKRKLGKKIIYDSHEYYPEAFSEHFSRGRKTVRGIIAHYEKKLASQADYIITVNSLLEKKFKEYNENVAVIRNYPVLKDMEFGKNDNGKPVFIYEGGLREDRGIFAILESIKYVKTKCRYIFIGDFDDNEFKRKVNDYVAESLGGTDIEFTGKIPHEKVFQYLRSADAGFVLLQPSNPRYVHSEPIKLFEYMMSKTAVIASNFPMIAGIVNTAKCGMLIEPDDTVKIAGCIDYIANNPEEAAQMGENGRRAVESKYNWSPMEDRLLSVYRSLEEL